MELFFIILYLIPIAVAFLCGVFGTVELEIKLFKFKKKFNYKWLLFIPGVNLIVLHEILSAVMKEKH